MRTAIAWALFGLTFALPGQEEASPWFLDFEKAKAAAKEKNLQILAYFTGSDWQKYCIQYHQETFSQKDFLDWAEKNVVLLEVDTPRDRKLDDAIKAQNEQLKKTYQITGLPTVLFLDAEGKVTVRMNGLTSGGPKAFFKEATKQGFDRSGKPRDAAAPVTGGAEKAAEPAKEKEKEVEIKPRNAAERAAWSTNYTEALASAKRQNRFVLAAFVGSDWSPFGQKLEDEIFSKPEFKKWAEKNVVLLELDFPEKAPQSDELKKQNKKLKEDLKVEDFPRVLFLNGSGKVVGKLAYMPGGPAAWIQAAEGIFKRARSGK